jgi:hypothetical protein
LSEIAVKEQVHFGLSANRAITPAVFSYDDKWIKAFESKLEKEKDNGKIRIKRGH